MHTQTRSARHSTHTLPTRAPAQDVLSRDSDIADLQEELGNVQSRLSRALKEAKVGAVVRMEGCVALVSLDRDCGDGGIRRHPFGCVCVFIIH